MKKLLSGLLFLLLLLACAIPGWAACTLPSSTASFGTVSSFAVNTTASNITANVNVNCGSGSVLSLLSTDYIRLQLASATYTSRHAGNVKNRQHRHRQYPASHLHRRRVRHGNRGRWRHHHL